MNSYKKILFFLSHQPNPRFIKQIVFFSKSSHVDVIHFDRSSVKTSLNEYAKYVDNNFNLGNITDGQYFRRVVSYVKLYKKVKVYLASKRYDYVLCNNFDTLLLFFLTRPKKNTPKIIIEISDLRAHCYKYSLKNWVIKKIESILFKRVDFLIVTSEKFLSCHYSKIYRGNTPFVLENKPLSHMIPERNLALIKRDSTPRLTIGIVGLLLQKEPYRALFDAVKGSDVIDVAVYGMGVYQGFVQDYARNYKNIHYYGPYNLFNDSARIYGSIDCLYMVYDTTNGSLNNKVALPNKLYEAMYFQVPVITSKYTYLAEMVAQYNIGFLVDACDGDQLIELLSKDFDKKLIALKSSFTNISRDMYLGDNDYKNLKAYLGL